MPSLSDMQGNPEYNNWGKNLTELATREEIKELQNIVKIVVSSSLTTLDPFNDFSNKEAKTLSLDVFFHASRIAQDSMAKKPLAAFLLSYISILGWTSSLGPSLYAQINGMPHKGWVHIPYVYALTSFNIGVIRGAKALVDESYDVLMSAKYQNHPSLIESLLAYRRLAGKIYRKYELSIHNLADDLRYSCKEKEPNFRAEFGALLWSLGFIPESKFFESTADCYYIPTRRFYRQIVKQSFECIPHDSLVQYIWLELKDRPPINIREHKDAFFIINERYSQLMLDEISPFDVTPSQSYARTIISLFKGNITKNQAYEYLKNYDLIKTMFPNIDWILYYRMSTLNYLLSKKFGWIDPEFDYQKELNYWFDGIEMACSVQENSNIRPGWPEIYSRFNHSFSNLIEMEFSKVINLINVDNNRLIDVLQAIEKFRTSTLSYWLKVIPPTISSKKQKNLDRFLEEENKLLKFLRGSYFLILHPLLPHHYQRHGRLMDEYLADSQKQKRLDPDVGRKQYKEINDELKSLYEEMKEIAPQYASRRLDPVANIDRIKSALGG